MFTILVFIWYSFNNLEHSFEVPLFSCRANFRAIVNPVLLTLDGLLLFVLHHVLLLSFDVFSQDIIVEKGVCSSASLNSNSCGG